MLNIHEFREYKNFILKFNKLLCIVTLLIRCQKHNFFYYYCLFFLEKGCVMGYEHFW